MQNVYIVISISYLLRCILFCNPFQCPTEPGFIPAEPLFDDLSEVVFSLVLLGTFKYHFVELIAATVIFDCVRETHKLAAKYDWVVIWVVDFDCSKMCALISFSFLACTVATSSFDV